MKRSAAVLLTLWAAGCATAPVPRAAIAEALLSASEALFRHQIGRAAAPTSEYAAVCISDQGSRPRGDPSPEIISRLRDIHPPVKPWSACRWNDVRPIDVVTGLPAIQIEHRLVCVDADHCTATGGDAFGNLGGHSFNYTLERRNGRWTVGELITAIS